MKVMNPLRLFLFLAVFIFPLGIMAQTLDAQQAGSSQKIKVVYHNVPLCPVSGIRVDGEHRKFEVVYVSGNVENHIYLAAQTYSKQFYNRPDFYLQKVEAMETGGGMGLPTLQ